MIKVNRPAPGSTGGTAASAVAAGRTGVRDDMACQKEGNRGDSMTDRESPGPQSGSSTPARSSTLPAGPLSPLLFAASAAPSFWEEWYKEASDSQRRQAIELAREQTVVVAHQLSAPE